MHTHRHRHRHTHTHAHVHTCTDTRHAYSNYDFREYTRLSPHGTKSRSMRRNLLKGIWDSCSNPDVPYSVRAVAPCPCHQCEAPIAIFWQVDFMKPFSRSRLRYFKLLISRLFHTPLLSIFTKCRRSGGGVDSDAPSPPMAKKSGACEATLFIRNRRG